MREEEERKRKEEISLEDVMGAIQTLSVDVNFKFVSVENCLMEFRAELGALKAEMVSRQMFDKLEARVSDLELKGFACPDLEFLRQQVDKFDPANKSIRVRGFVQKSLNERKSCVDKIIQDLGISVLRSDHIGRNHWWRLVVVLRR